jgi:hypothetical protein
VIKIQQVAGKEIAKNRESRNKNRSQNIGACQNATTKTKRIKTETQTQRREKAGHSHLEKHSVGHHNHSYNKQGFFATLPTNQFQDWNLT